MRFLGEQMGLNLRRSKPVEAYRSPGPFGVFAEEVNYQPRVWHFDGSPANDNKPRGKPPSIPQEYY